jgi:hypothetical protein
VTGQSFVHVSVSPILVCIIPCPSHTTVLCATCAVCHLCCVTHVHVQLGAKGAALLGV